MTRTVMTVFGTRPEAIKLVMLIRALHADPEIRPVTVVTAQHREMLDQVLDLFEVAPDHDLDMMRDRQTLTGVTTRSLDGLTPIVEAERPDLVVVQGDTTTTFTGALAAFYQQVPVAHVEAGLRSGDRYSPFPEEVNRRLTTQVTSLHLPPTPESRDNLLRDGVDPADVVVTGNTVIDALHHAVAQAADWGQDTLADLDDDDRRVLLVTAHRRESWGEGMEGIGTALARIATRYPDLRVVFPIHYNPVVREAIMPKVADLPNVTVVDPLSYGPFARLLDRAHVILTDSGGIQEEGPSLGKPVLVMRDNTERPEAVQAGTAKLVGTDANRLVEEVATLLDDEAAYGAMANAVNPYGDGKAVDRCVQAIRHHLGLQDHRPAEFDAGVTG